MSTDKELIVKVAKAVCEEIGTYEHRNQLTLLADKSCIVDLCYELRDNEETAFDMLIDVTAVDWNRPEQRFEVVYFLYSNKYKSRVRIKAPVEESEPRVPSVTEVWKSANWYERETYDMYGIKFDNHPDLRRFYMPEDYVDPISGEPLYPMRKEFPLMGVPDSLPLPPFPERDGEE